MKHAFLFDMDGVIVDSNPAHKKALQEFCKKHGHDLTEAQLRDQIYGRTNKDWLPALFGALTPEKLTSLANEKEALFRRLYEKEIEPVAGLISFLEKIQRHNIPLAIATSAPKDNVDFTLSKTNTTKYFKVVLDESFVTKGKPDPEIYVKSAAALNMPPLQCIVFEDSLSGVAAAKAAGCKVIGVMTTHSAEELYETDMVIKDFVDLDPLDVLNKLF